MAERRLKKSGTFAGSMLFVVAALGQTGRVYTAADYAQAEKFMPYEADPLVFHTVDKPAWLADGRFWYRDAGPDGVTFRLVDPAKKTAAPAFDHAHVADMLNEAVRAGKLGVAQPATMDAGHLPIDDFLLEDADRSVLLTIGRERVRCALRGTAGCMAAGEVNAGMPTGPYDLSPDKQRAAFLRGNNLWVREVASGRETQLTTDGQPDFGYATDNAGWTHSDAPIVVWSPDSKKLATFQMDQRRVGRMALVSTTDGHPQIDVWHYPLPGDAVLPTITRVVIDLEADTVVRLKMPPDQHRSSLCDDISCAGGHGWDDVQWSADGRQVAFVSTSRDHKQETLHIADAATGEVRDVLSETVPTYFESGQGKVNWSYLAASKEVLWFSERDGHGQIYLYDAATGKLKNQVTRGTGEVTEVLRVDAVSRVMYFLAVGGQSGWDPYFAALYRIKLDGSGERLLTPEPADHAISFAPAAAAYVDVWSTPIAPQTALVRDLNGTVLVQVAQQDITRLRASGWVPPVPFTVKARDGNTDLYGLLFRPTSFDPAKHYPLVDHVYPGPQTGSCGSRAFSATHGDMQSLAELGFIVLCLDGTGTPYRGKTFHDAHFGQMGDNTIPDQVAGIRQLAARFPWIDASRVGIYGHSGGGAAAAAAMFSYPDFFKVGISESGNHDNRVYEDDWAEKWQGLLVRTTDGTTNYDNQANQAIAKNLKGHLLLMHGTMDDNVPPSNTLLVVQALIRANKDFDLLLIPNAKHSYGTAAPYVTRRRWDYLVRNLAGDVPPPEYRMKNFSEQ